MKQELVQLAKDKGFIATFVHDKPFIYSSKEPLRWLFWMTELQKWLRDVHKIHIVIDKVCNLDFSITYWNFEICYTNNEDVGLILSGYCGFKEALEAGLFESLKLIKDEHNI